MIVVMNPRCAPEDINRVVDYLRGAGCNSWVAENTTPRFVEALGAGSGFDRGALEHMPMVDRVVAQADPFLAAGRRPEDATREVPLGSTATVGGRKLAVIAGPCSVESRGKLLEIAAAVKEAGAVALRGGAFKPRTSPYSFQGHGEHGLELLALAREETGLAIVTEVLASEHIELVARYADVLQVGSRNMHDTHFLTALGRQDRPVLLKRGWSATLEEFLFAAEYVLLQGNRNVILCERGIRTHEEYVRNTLALSIVPEIKRVSTLPIIVDPSHGTGQSHLVTPMCYAATACGADGLLIEVHVTPEQAWSDAPQAITPEQFAAMMQRLPRFAAAVDRQL